MRPRKDNAAEATRRFRALDREYRREARRRSSLSLHGLPKAAATGDREALERCAEAAAVMIETGSHEPRFHALRAWLLDALYQVRSGTEPNKAFGYSRPRSGNPGGGFESLETRRLVLESIAGYLANEPSLPLKAAKRHAAESRGLPYSHVDQIWKDAAELSEEE